MERIKINLPGTFSFTTRIPIRITDINYGNHVGNHVFFELAHEARMRFLQNLGYTELNIGGPGLIMAEAAIEFKAELIYGDEVEISVAVGDLTNSSFNFYYLLTGIRNDKSFVAAKAKTAMVFFNYEKKKVMMMPEAIREKLAC